MTELAAAAAIVVLWQYTRRNTFATRVAALATAACLLASSSLLPWKAAFALQTHFSKQNIAPSSIHIQLDSDRKWLGRIYPAENDRIVADLPLRISGVPAGAELKPNGLTISLRAPDGETWVVKEPPSSSFSFEAGIISLRAMMGTTFYDKVKNQSLQLRGTLFFTLYGNKQIVPIPLNSNAVPVSDVGLCSAGAQFLHCDSVFRAPSDLVSIRIWQDSDRGPRTTTESPFPSTSYSPFPADLGIDPLHQSFFAPLAATISQAHAEVRQPLAHIEQQFEIEHVRLSDFAVLR